MGTLELVKSTLLLCSRPSLVEKTFYSAGELWTVGFWWIARWMALQTRTHIIRWVIVLCSRFPPAALL